MCPSAGEKLGRGEALSKAFVNELTVESFLLSAV